jgi:hypothetical protein
VLITAGLIVAVGALVQGTVGYDMALVVLSVAAASAALLLGRVVLTSG